MGSALLRILYAIPSLLVLAILSVVGAVVWLIAVVLVLVNERYPESLWRFRIKHFGPLLVGMDSHGGSLFADNQKEVASRRDAVLKSIGAA